MGYMTELCELAVKYGTDKVSVFRHDYTPYYHSLLSGKRQSARRVLEIGIGYPSIMCPPGYLPGASLRMWRDYFPNAMIYALDIRPDILIREERIESFLCDQGDEGQLRAAAARLDEKLDLILDDGSHRTEDQLLSAEVLVPLLAPDGVYIIEDILDEGCAGRLISCLPYKCFLREFNIQKVKDDRLVVILEGDQGATDGA